MGTEKVVIVGGGPAGMMACIRASALKQEATLIEKNSSLGRKLLLSGKGRSNLTNACSLDAFLERFSKNGQFLRDAFKNFFNRDLMDFFETRGLKLKVERQLRVFPVTDKSDSVLEVLKKELKKNRVKIIYNSTIYDILTQGGRVRGIVFRNRSSFKCDRVILATGGISYGFTGSTGEGLAIAKNSGHHIVMPRAGLVPLETREDYPRLLEGLALKNIRVRFTSGKKSLISEIGELIFTRFGISGPLVLSLSGKVTDWLAEKKDVYAEIDLKPALSKERLEVRLLREFSLNAKKTIKNTLKSLLPQRLISVFISIAKLSPDKKVNQITQKERKALASLLKALRLEITRPRPIEEAMVTRGGVSLKDIDPRTMQSRLIKGLYFAGEMIDVDGDTGGFNLQAAFSTGYLAGNSLIYKLK